MIKHTPGPWIIDGRVIRTEFGGQVCMLSNMASANKKEWEANSRLISASPYLLEALQKVVNAFLPSPEWDGVQVAEEARAAISKATGG